MPIRLRYHELRNSNDLGDSLCAKQTKTGLRKRAAVVSYASIDQIRANPYTLRACLPVLDHVLLDQGQSLIEPRSAPLMTSETSKVLSLSAFFRRLHVFTFCRRRTPND